MEDDSVSEITEIDKNEILNHYYTAIMTRAQKKNAERKITQERLYNTKKCGAGFNCNTCTGKYGELLGQKKHNGRPKSSKSCENYNQNRPMVLLELREPKKPNVMFDEEISAHQFSLFDKYA